MVFDVWTHKCYAVEVRRCDPLLALRVLPRRKHAKQRERLLLKSASFPFFAVFYCRRRFHPPVLFSRWWRQRRWQHARSRSSRVIASSFSFASRALCATGEPCPVSCCTAPGDIQSGHPTRPCSPLHRFTNPGFVIVVSFSRYASERFR